MSGYDRWRRLRHAAMAVRVGVLVKDGTPATIPVEQAAKFALIFNLKTARAMGLPVPQSLLLRADQVIE